MNYRYPSAQEIYPDRDKKSYFGKRLRYNLRSLLHRSNIQAFSQFIQDYPELHPLLQARPNFNYPLVHRFLDKRFNAKQRLAAFCDNLTFLPTQLKSLHRPPLWEQPILLGEVVPDFELYLNINEHQPMEGFWALELRQVSSQQLIYLLTFGKIEQALLIAVIQGANTEDAKAQVKHLTKICHGLRPAYLMVEAMKLLTQALGFNALLGIPHYYQNKSRLVQSKRYTVNYDTIFSESGATEGKYWQLPLTLDTDLSDVPSKKRSMYRKRFAMLEALGESIKKVLAKN